MQEFGYIRLHRLSGEPDMVRIMSIDIEHLYSCNRDWQGSSRISTFDGFMFHRSQYRKVYRQSDQ